MILTAEQFGGVNIKVFKRFLTRERERFLKIAGINKEKVCYSNGLSEITFVFVCCVM